MSAYLSTDPTVYADFTFVVTDTGVGAPVNNIAIEYYNQAYAPANFIAGGSLASVLGQQGLSRSAIRPGVRDL